MKKSFLIALLLSVGAAVSAQGTYKRSATQVLPKLLYIQGHKIVLKKGYAFQRVSENEVNVVNTSTALISGTFQCGCHTDTGGGTCTVETLEDRISCVPVSCNDCGMRTTIDPPKPEPLKGQPQGTKKPYRNWTTVNLN